MNPCLKTIFAVASFSSLASAVILGQTIAYNSGSLGGAGNGINNASVTLGLPGAVAAGGDLAVGYDGLAALTSVPFNPSLNPPAASPFTVEFWAKPAAPTGSIFPCPLFNRVSSSPRSGWIFFQGAPVDTTLWNFRMYNGVNQSPGIDLKAALFRLITGITWQPSGTA